LVTISVVASYWIIETQTQDALVINLAGRQRMLIQQMTKDALEIEKYGPQIGTYRQSIIEAIATFDQTLTAFSRGGSAPYLPVQPVDLEVTRNPAILNALRQLTAAWPDFARDLNVIVTTPPGQPGFTAAMQAIEETSPQLVQRADVIVRLFENESTQKVTQLRRVQLIFFASAIILLVMGVWVIQTSTVEPLRVLEATARRIGAGDLETPVDISGPDEIRHLARNFDGMRVQLKTSQDELEAQVRQRTLELTNAFEFSQEIVTELELNRLLLSVTNRARELLGARAASVCLLTPEGDNLALKASSGESAPSSDLNQLAAGQSLALQVVGQGETVITSAACTNCRFLLSHAPGQCVATPLHTGDRTLGALCVVRAEQEQFDTAETRALTLLANSAATAITNANLVEFGQQQAKEAASLAERERLAAELHDNLAQTLSYLNIKTDRLGEMVGDGQLADVESELTGMKSAITTAYGQVRAALVGLREPVISVEGELAAKLNGCIDDFRQVSNIFVDLLVADASALELSPVGQKQALHIVKESLNNIHRHAQAGRVEVRVERDKESARFTIADNGQGFNLTRRENGNHLGLTIMRARAERCGGSLTIDTAPGRGTKIIARLPLQNKGQEPDRTGFGNE
jgi:two-component system nitrate/nitrite sensor histidine kinase NarX